MKCTTTLLFLLRDGEILLAMKKRGHGVGNWNGVGGKAEPGETALAAAIRECQEEIGVTPIKPKLVGRLKFLDQSDPNFCHDSHIFVTANWQGEPHETDEMRPQWFTLDSIPYDQMWPDDRFWLPPLLQGKLFSGNVTTDSLANNALVHHDIREVHELEV
jgi:8-oxo-dGTP pyrophosphatase MutT (NUDIX family)